MSKVPLENLSDRELLLLLASTINDVVQRLDKQNGRIDGLERWRNQSLGGFAVISFALGSGVVGLMLGWIK